MSHSECSLIFHAKSFWPSSLASHFELLHGEVNFILSLKPLRVLRFLEAPWERTFIHHLRSQGPSLLWREMPVELNTLCSTGWSAKYFSSILTWSQVTSISSPVNAVQIWTLHTVEDSMTYLAIASLELKSMRPCVGRVVLVKLFFRVSGVFPVGKPIPC